MKIIVDHARCEGHAVCAHVAPDLFTLDEMGYNRSPPREIDAESEALARRAARGCPERAITLVED
jgi:ferredoxin